MRSVPTARPPGRRRHRLAWTMSCVLVLTAVVLVLRQAQLGAPASPAPAAASRTTLSPTPAPGLLGTPAPPGSDSPPVSRTPSSAASSGRGSVLIKVPMLRQLPELPNGCEVTSLAMLLTASGIPTSKMTLARQQPTDSAQPVFRPGAQGDLTKIARWGDPNRAFVGNVYGKYGYGIYHGPLFKLLVAKAGPRGRDLTGQDFAALLAMLDRGHPVMIWVTTTMRPTGNWVSWQGPAGPVRATFREHAVLLVGYTRDTLILNNPLTGTRETVAKQALIKAWQQLGRQALAVLPPGE